MLEAIKGRSTCRSKKAALIIDPDSKMVISYGYNGAPAGVTDCLERDYCFREQSNKGMPVSPGDGLELCIGAHAEVNAIANSAKMGGKSLKGCLMIASHRPCVGCLKSIVNSGISEVVFVEDYPLDSRTIVMWHLIEMEANISIKSFKDW